MKTWKFAALMVSGGVLLQVGSCTTILTDLLINAALSALSSGLLGAVGGTGV
jgi:hypothetical protein